MEIIFMLSNFINLMELLNVKSHIINLGKSETKSKIYKIKTKLKLSNNFVSFPFGSTRIRFQYDELFEFELYEDQYENKTEENYDYYTLKVTKKEVNLKNCPHNMKYFYSDGWNIDLRVLNIASKCKNDLFCLTEEILYQLIPENYGSLTLSLSANFPTTYKIGIVTPIYSRHEYLIKFLDSLSVSILSQCVLVLIDESMCKDVNNDKILVNKLVKEYENKNVTIIKIYKNTHGNMFDSILTGFDLLSTFCDYLMTIDSDTIHKSNWIEKYIGTFDKVKKDICSDNILLSGFNTINRGTHIVLSKNDNYVLKKSVGGCNMFFKSILYHNFIRKALMSHKWDSNILKIMSSIDGSVIVTTNPSVVEHIGYQSSVQTDEEYDYSCDF